MTGLTVAVRGGFRTLWGRELVTDTARELFHGEPPVPEETFWARGATSFFQGNRYLTGALVREVLALAVGDRVADLYAGVGLFAVALAARGTRVIAVESDTQSGGDLKTNAEPYDTTLTVHLATIEAMGGTARTIRRRHRRSAAHRALAAGDLQRVADCHAPRIVYVSCDPPTLARDAAILAEGLRAAISSRLRSLSEHRSRRGVASFDR